MSLIHNFAVTVVSETIVESSSQTGMRTSLYISFHNGNTIKIA